MAPHHAVDLTTFEKYSYSLGKHIIPFFGDMRMIGIMPQDIREWITWMQDRKASAWTIQYCKTSLALNDQVGMIHPCHGIKMPSARRPSVRSSRRSSSTSSTRRCETST